MYAYITARNQWVSVGEMGERAEHCAVSLSSNSIFMPGGIIENEDKQSYSSVTELLQMHDVL